MKLHELSIKRPVAVTMAVLIFIVLGLYSLSMFSMEMMPDINFSMVVVATQYSNVGSAEVENLVTKTVENAVSSVSGVNSITSQSSEGISMVMLELDNDVDIDKAVADMQNRLDMMEDYLPEGAEKPTVIQMDTNMMPVAMMSVSVEGYDLSQTKKFVESEVQSRIEAVSGVASVSVYGAQDRQIEVLVDPEKLFGYRMQLSDVAAAIAAQNQNLPAGSVTELGKNLSLRVMGKMEKVSDLQQIPLMTKSGQVIYLRDVASIRDTYARKTSLSRLNGKDSLMISISKQSDANTVEVVTSLVEALEQIQEENARFSYHMTMEQASYIQDAVSSVAENAVLGGVLAVLILLLFLGNIRSSLVIGISMPISVITTFIGMYFAGMTLNVVSLGGLALGVGMLVDNSVVVLENIFRRRKEYKEDGPTAGMRGAGEVVGAVVASVLTTCIVYVPVLFIDNMMAVMFRQLGFAIIFSQVASLLTTFLLVPMLSARIQQVDQENPKLAFLLRPFQRFLERAYVWYEQTLRRVLQKRKKFVYSVLGGFVVSLFVLGQLGMTLMPAGDEGIINISLSLPAGTKLENTNQIALQAEEIIRQNEAVETISTNVGADSMSTLTGATASDSASMTITLADKKHRRGTTADVMEELRAALSDIAGAEVTLEASNSAMNMATDEVSFQFSGEDDAVLSAYLEEAEAVLAQIDGVVETSSSMEQSKSELRIYLDSDRASRYGLNTATVSSLVHQVLEGQTASRFTENGKEYDIVLTYPEGYAEKKEQLRTLSLASPVGQWVTLGDIAEIRVEKGYNTLHRADQKRTVTLTAKLYETDMQTASQAFSKALEQIPCPEGITHTEGGSYEMMMDAMKSLFLAILLGILLMYLIMAAQFENLLQPLLILGTVPLVLIGVVLALLLTRSPLSVVGCIGILMLMGIIVNNAIVLLDFVNTAKKEQPELSHRERVVLAGKVRLRPILMTTLTSVLGFLPMAFSTASGSEMMKPLAVVLVGGLSVGTLLTLFFIPVLYTLVEERLSKRSVKK